MDNFSFSELGRLLRNIVRLGTVAAIDLPGARVKIASNGLTTAWLMWGEACAGEIRTWSPPVMGEQVLLLSPGGDAALAVVVARLNQDAFAAPFSDGKIHGVKYADGAEISYNRQTHALKAILPVGGTLEVSAPGGVTITAPTITLAGNTVIQGTLTGTTGTGGGGTATFSGNVSTTADVLAGSKSLKTHTHGGVQTGSGNTAAPN